MRTQLVLLALGVALFSACATTTKIISDPPGANVVDEATKKEIGKTPLTYESKMWIWESQKFQVKGKNTKPKTVELKRSEVDLLPMVGGGCLTLTCCGAVAGVPIILAGGFKLPAEIKVKLDVQSDAAPPVGLLDPLPAPGDVVAVRY